jgi:hypothetical protein
MSITQADLIAPEDKIIKEIENTLKSLNGEKATITMIHNGQTYKGTFYAEKKGEKYTNKWWFGIKEKNKSVEFGAGVVRTIDKNKITIE